MKYSSIELALPRECVNDLTGSGQKDDIAKEWLSRPEISQQFENLTLLDSARILYGYGAWEPEELKSLEDNKMRLLWTAAGDAEESEDWVDDTAFVTLEGHGYEDELSSLES